MNNFKELKVWQKAIEIATDIYVLTKTFPKEEQFGIVNQMRRAACSIAFNIAEGDGRNTEKEFNHFLGIAIGSSFETETQLIVSKNVGYISEEQLCSISEKIAENQKMIRGLQKTLNL
ncbi:MAG TPA: four helix bundle protein [Bacteroidales bacterium]|nr:four helix bundle protein [Bacteroidales bacterium]